MSQGAEMGGIGLYGVRLEKHKDQEPSLHEATTELSDEAGAKSFHSTKQRFVLDMEQTDLS